MGEIRITGITYLPEWAGDPVASPILRELPTSKIEAAINRRQFSVTDTIDSRKAGLRCRADALCPRPR